jgi:hypothetical protein
LNKAFSADQCTDALASHWAMRTEDIQRMYELCALLDKEQDHNKCRRLIDELTQIPERTRDGLEEKKE